MLVFKSDKEVQKKLSTLVRSHRIKSGYSQKELSERSGVKLSTLRVFEQKGEISLSHLIQILRIFDLIDSVVKALDLPIQSLEDIEDNTDLDRKRRVRGN